MSDWFIEHIWWVPLYPLLASVLIILGRSFVYDGRPEEAQKGLFTHKKLSMYLTVGATALGLVHSLWAINAMTAAHSILPIEKNIPWLHAGNFTLSMGYLLDNMSVMMLFVVTFISLLIQIYTHGYMEHDSGYCKFYAYLALFNFSMLGLVLSSNLFQIYVFWELVGVSSYLLIGFWFHKASAGAAAIKAFLMNRVGDFGLLLGILGFLFFSAPFWINYLPSHSEQALLSFQGFQGAADFLVHSGLSPFIIALIAILIFMGPVAKSAQVPLHTWLPDAMEGPTPISALIHAATMVAAGVYLIGRVFPVFASSEIAMIVVALVGTLTAFIGATIALTQYDIKKALAYSTMSQLGYMVAAMGLGAFTAGLFHLFTHAFFKAMLFLCSGSVIHACEDEQDMRKMGGLWSKLPVTAWTYLIGTCAITGLAWTSGFWSKDMILIASEKIQIVNIFLTITAAMTAFYMFRTFFMTFVGEYRGEAHVHHENPVMTMPLVILGVFSLFIGMYLSGSSPIPAPFAFGDYITYVTHAAPDTHGAAAHHTHTFMEAVTSQVGIMSQVIAVGGLGLAYLFYGPKPALKSSTIREMFAPVHRLFSKKWYFDELYAGFVENIYLKLIARPSWNFDAGLIDGIVNWTGRTVVGSAVAMRELQSGRIQDYIMGIFFSVVMLAFALYYWLL